MLKIYLYNKLNNSADIWIPLLFLKIHSEFRPRPIWTITSPADYLTASTLYHQLAALSSTDWLWCSRQIFYSIFFCWDFFFFFLQYSTLTGIKHSINHTFWFTKPSPNVVKSSGQIRSWDSHKGGSVGGTWIHLLKLIYLSLRKTEFFDQKELRQPHA